MTARAAHRSTPRTLRGVADFSRLDCVQASERVRQLVSVGLAEALVADLIGWDLSSVRRTCCARHGPGSALRIVRDAND
jgi:hypothetical protein